jgi:hypothetical protein
MSGAVMVMSASEVRAQHFQRETSLYTGQGIQRLQRHWAFLRQSSPPVKGIAAASIFGPAAAGAVAGKDLGEAVVQAFFSNEGEKDDSLKVKAGRYIGAFFGGLCGAAGGAYVYMTGVEQTSQFEIWREIKIYQTLKESTSFNYSEDPILREHCCPISLFPMIVPVISPTPGKTCYELEQLLGNSQRQSDDEKIIIDPCTNTYTYHEDSLVIDYERGVLVNKRIRHLLRTDLAQLPKESPLKEVLNKLIAEVDEIIKNHYDSARSVIEAKRESGELDQTAYYTELQRFHAKCGFTKENDLTWSAEE